MKVRTHVKAGEFAASGVASTNSLEPSGGLPDGHASSWLEELGRRVKQEVTPWFTIVYHANEEDNIAQGETTSVSFAALDTASQAFAQRWLDPLFGDTRERQRQALGVESGPLAISPAEQTINRYVLASIAIIGATVAGSTFFPPLLLAAFAGAFFITLPLYVEAYENLAHEHRVKSAFTFSLGMTGAWVGGFFLAGALSGVLYYLAQKLIYKTEDRARQTLANVFGQQPRTVWLVVDGVEVEVPLERVQVGDTVAVQAGQAIPVDGTVIRGIASIDQHTLTGEAQPVERGPGDTVLATTTMLTGSIHIRVDQAGEATAAAQITDILNRTSSYQLGIESQAARIADTLAVPALILSGIAWPTVGYEGAISLLTANLGWNVKLTGPLAMLNYLNIISRSGVLIKDGRSLELLHTIDTIVFDKTGTLTLEQPHVAHVHVFNGFTSDEVLALAATAEQRQSHPIARAILTAAQTRGLPLQPINDIHYEVGFGIRVRLDDQLIRVGSARYMALEGIELPEAIHRVQAECGEQGHSLVLVAVGELIRGALEMHATLRPEAKQVIDQLRQRNLKLYILSGDHDAPTRRMARVLGIDNYIAGVLPEGKAAVIEQLQQEGRRVCFVGDGINDAIALKKANVSISLRGATTIAVDAAQVVLMDQSLNHLTNALDVADEFHSNLQYGIGWAVVPDALLIAGVFLAHTGIYAALTIGNLGLLGGIATAMLPLLRHRSEAETGS